MLVRKSSDIANEAGSKFGRSTLGGIGDFLGITTEKTTVGDVTAHEMGHALYLMQIGAKGHFDEDVSNASALRLENAARKAQDPNARTRIVH